MTDNFSLEWNKDSLRALRLRLGWSRSDLARRLKCDLSEVDLWEEGHGLFDAHVKGELEIMYRQCLECSEEVKHTPASEAALDRKALDQINFSQLKQDLE